MHAGYTWTVDGSIIHHVKEQTLPKGCQYSTKPCNTMIKSENRITAHPSALYFTVFSLKDEGVRVSLSKWTGRHPTSASPYINVGVSVGHMFIF